MDLIHPDSLSATVTAAARFLFEGGTLPPDGQKNLTGFLLSHQNRKAGFVFHSLPGESPATRLLVTGEQPRTRLLADNALECEALRLLAALDPASVQVRETLAWADHRLERQCFASVCTTGECTGASIAWLRYRSVREPDGDLSRRGVAALRQFRDGRGRWKRFPFWYTLMWLVELPLPLAQEELAYAAPACQRAASSETEPFRRSILQRATTGKQ